MVKKLSVEERSVHIAGKYSIKGIIITTIGLLVVAILGWIFNKPDKIASQNQIINNAPNQGVQINEVKITTNSKPKAREVTDSLIEAIINKTLDKRFEIYIYRRSHDDESLEFTLKIQKILLDRGYVNVHADSGALENAIITQSIDEERQHFHKIFISIDKNTKLKKKYLLVIVPPNE
jgi:hypothetical protein